MSEGIGTHLDAPAHCHPGGKCIDELDINDLIAPCVVIDVSEKSHEHYRVGHDDITQFEYVQGTIQKGSFVIIRTGWEKYWNEPEKYRNNLVFPCLSEEVATLLLHRGIVGLGIDTLSPDRPDNGYPVHKILLEGGKYIVENIANSGNLPAVGSYSLALPIKIQNGTEAPVRLVGLTFLA
jgi:kynurenine formamidase